MGVVVRQGGNLAARLAIGQHYGITVSRSGLVRAVDRASRHAQPTYAALRHQVRHSPVVTPDETGWKVAGRLNWLWVVATPQTTVYQIQPGRGYPEAANLLGKDFAGVIVRDGWALMHPPIFAGIRSRRRPLDTPAVP